MDVKSDFLNGLLHEEVYVKQPPVGKSFQLIVSVQSRAVQRPLEGQVLKV